ARVAEQKIMVKTNGKKTAWMGTYYDQHGQERDVDPHMINANGERCPLVVMPDGREVPQATSYTHLGTPLLSEWKHHGMQEARLKEVQKCRQLITFVGRIDDSLSEDNLAEAWLLMRVRAKVRVNRTTTELFPLLELRLQREEGTRQAPATT
ncbi:MAG: hypothetical protein SGPRY_005171, partial [Prymnesium sp.]